MRIDRTLLFVTSGVVSLFWLAWIIWILVRAPLVASHEDVLADFAQFYAGARVLADGRAAELYAPRTLPEAIDAAAPWTNDALFPAVYPAHVYAAFRPALALPLVPAAVVFGALSVLLYGAAIRTMEGWRPDVWLLRCMAFASPALLYVIPAGQLSIIPLVQLAVTWRAWRTGRMGLAGLVLGTLAWKPQLLLIGAVALLVRPGWRLLAGIAVGAGIHAVLFTAVVGIDGWAKYAGALRQMADIGLFSTWRLQSLRGALSLLLTDDTMLWLVLVPVTLGVLGACRWLAARSDDGTAFALAVIGGLLISPHVYAYDGLLVVAALYVVGERALSRGHATASDLWAYALYWAPGLVETARFTRIQPVCLAMLGWLVARAMESRAGSTAAPDR